jgi:predicted RNA binding protein YcfA (HicA-like mRNA interferase family)
MGRQHKRFSRIIHGGNDANIRFDDLCSLLRSLGFRERIRGSHHLFERPDVSMLINLQRQGSAAKAYQVRQVRRVLIDSGLSHLRLEDEE